jgi:hypothetical protein
LKEPATSPRTATAAGNTEDARMTLTSKDVRELMRRRAQQGEPVLRQTGYSKYEFAKVATPADDGLNKTERAYRDHLEFRQRAGEIKRYWTHGVTLKLGKDCRYTVDFVVQENDGTLTFVEIKGFLRDDALVKFRAAQAAFPIFKFVMVQRCKGGTWKTIRE